MGREILLRRKVYLGANTGDVSTRNGGWLRRNLSRSFPGYFWI